jgi:hypothetical protein
VYAGRRSAVFGSGAPEVSAPWRGPAQFAGGALVLTIVAMWAAQPPSGCTMRSEPRRHLNLDRTVDREHLATDLAESERIARRYSAQPDANGESCRAGLVRQIMATHDVTPAQMLAATGR